MLLPSKSPLKLPVADRGCESHGPAKLLGQLPLDSREEVEINNKRGMALTLDYKMERMMLYVVVLPFRYLYTWYGILSIC